MPPRDVDHFLGPDGTMARTWGGFEARPAQLDMARAVAEVLESGGVLTVEAPTGIGKSLAYLIPAILHQRAQGLPVAIATHTLHLQDQLLDKDVPLAAAALAETGGGEPLRVTVLKGRTNYLCRRRYEDARRGLLPLRAGTLERLSGWVADTETGDLTECETEVGSLGEDRSALAADSVTCAWSRCRRGDDCFLRRLRHRAQTSHVVIANHALLLHHLLRDSAFLPDADALVLDEAHHVERTLTDACGREVSPARLRGLLLRSLGAESERRAPDDAPRLAIDEASGPLLGALGRSAERLRSLPSDVDRLELARRLAGVRSAMVAAAEQAAAALRAVGARFAAARFADAVANGDAHTLRYTSAESRALLGPEIESAQALAAAAARAVKELASAIEAAMARAPGLSPGSIAAGGQGFPFGAGPPEAGEAVADLIGLAAEWGALADDLAALTSPADHEVAWIATGPGGASLHALPLAVAALFAERVLDRFRATILTSATLAVAGGFEHLAGRLGLDRRDARRTHYLALESPFEHRRQCVVLADPSFVSPTAPGHAAAVAGVLEDLLRRVRRRTLVLFTSNALLRSVHRRLAPLATALGRPLFAQGVDGSRQGIAARHRRLAGSMLLGTASFWEGVDFPGEELEVLVITRLPFPVPTEPLIAARSERLAAIGEEPFAQLFLPEAVLRFRQGFGRLIRSLEDRGAVLCLDPRLLTARYGDLFVRSLPVTPDCLGGTEFAMQIEEWFATGELRSAADPPAFNRDRRGSRKKPLEVAEDRYIIDRLELDPGEDALRERAAEWRSRVFVEDDGSTVTVERLRRSPRARPGSHSGPVPGPPDLPLPPEEA